MKKKRFNIILLLLPQFFLTFLLIYAVLFSLIQSFGYIPSLGLYDFKLDYYIELFQNKQTLQSILFSLWTAFLSSSLSLIFALWICYFFTQEKKQANWIKKCLQIPIIIPHLIVALFVIQFFGQTGLIARFLYQLGFVQAQEWMASFLYDPQGKGVILAYLWKEVPFVIFFCFSIIRQINDSLGEAARTLGASPWQAYIHVILPLCKKTIIISYLIIFLYAFGAYELPALLGPTLPQSLPQASYQAYTHPDLHHRPYAMALNGIIILISLVFTLTFFAFLSKNKTGQRKERKEGGQYEKI